MVQSVLVALRKSSPKIQDVSPLAAIPGGEFRVRGTGLTGGERALARFGDVPAPVVIGSDSLMIVRVPDGARQAGLFVGQDGGAEWNCGIGIPVADSLHAVANPAVDEFGNIFVTFSGSAGQKTHASIYRIDTSQNSRVFVSGMMNATSMAFDGAGQLYVSSRHDGVVYKVDESGNFTPYVEGMGVATGIAFDRENNLYVGDRSGTVFKISRERQIYVFATLEPSISAYHLAFGADGNLFVTGPTTSSFDAVHRISNEGKVDTFYRGLGRPQGMAADANGNLYVAASFEGRRGVVRFDTNAKPELFLSGPMIVGVAFTPSRAMVVATNHSIYRVDVNIEGRRLP